MKRHGSLRVSDAEREAVVDRLRVAAGEGRLEHDELEQRVGAALRARTYAELTWLVADLPRSGAPVPRSRGRTLVRSALIASGLAVATVMVLAVVVLVVLATLAVAAALWVAVVVFWLVVRGPRRRLARPAGFV